MCNSTLWPTHCWIELKNSKYIPIQHFKKSLCRFYLHSVVLNKFLMWYADELSRMYDSAWPPFFRNIAPRYFSWHFYTNQDIAISKKKISPQLLGFQNASGCQNRLRIVEILFIFICQKLKKTPCIMYVLIKLACPRVQGIRQLHMCWTPPWNWTTYIIFVWGICVRKPIFMWYCTITTNTTHIWPGVVVQPGC